MLLGIGYKISHHTSFELNFYQAFERYEVHFVSYKNNGLELKTLYAF